jgi:uncharacterized protein (TIGR02996 family)
MNGDSFPPPLHLAEAGAWMAYSDWLQEQGRPYRQAARMAQGLERANRLILVGQYGWDGRHPLLRGIGPKVGPAWKDYAALRWWTPRGFRLRAIRDGKSCLVDDIPLLLSQPSDFPDLVASRRILAWKFFWAVARPVKRSSIP